MAETRPIGTRGSFRRLSTGLIAYGLIGLIVAAVGIGALVWVNGRFSALRGEVETTVDQLVTTTERTARALHDASTTAQSFSVTLDSSAAAMPAVSGQIAGLRSDLAALEGQLRSVNIFGTTPLASAADAIGRVTAGMEGLDTQLSLIGVVLKANGDALAGNATSFDQLGDSTSALATRLGSGVVDESLDDVQLVIVVTLLVFVAGSVVPAVGALLLGIGLRRTLAGAEEG